jgi:hypothetical protein
MISQLDHVEFYSSTASSDAGPLDRSEPVLDTIDTMVGKLAMIIGGNLPKRGARVVHLKERGSVPLT